jgi:hypothetical protein
MLELATGEAAWLVGFLVGLAVGVALTRWLWIDGSKKALRRTDRDGEC